MAESIDLYADIPKVPDKYARKKKKPKEIAVVEPGNCTGCEMCVPFCPVNCIEVAPASEHPDRPIPPVRIRYNECIGCNICERVCSKMSWDAITMVATEKVEAMVGAKFTDKFVPEGEAKKPAPPAAPPPAAPAAPVS
jgi:electron transport complex protein RnfB